jgi:hypothetical protein
MAQKPKTDDSPAADVLALVRAALGTLQFGSILLTVHEGRPVQLDVTDRKRFTR